MVRFLRLWCLLAPLTILGTALISVLGFHHVDLRYETFVQVLGIPTAQASVLIVATRSRSPASLRQVAVGMWRHSLTPVVAIMDVVLIAAGFANVGHPLFDIAGGQLQKTWVGTKGIVAAFFFTAAVFKSVSLGRWFVLMLAAVSLGFGSNFFWFWLGRLPATILPNSPTIIQWLVVYGGCFTLAMVVIAAGAGALTAQHPLAALQLNGTLGFAFAAALTICLNVFLHPYLEQPWDRLVWACASLSASCLLIGGILAAVPPNRARN